MNTLDQYKQGKLGLWDLVAHYSSGGDVRELLELAGSQPDRISAIFVLSELYEAADPVWKDIIKYAADHERHTAYGVLKIVHEHARETSNFTEVMQAISLANLEEDVIFAKVVAIINSVRDSSLKLMLNHSIATGTLGYHSAGLLLLIGHDAYNDEDLQNLYLLGNKTLNVYICSVIARYHEGKNIEQILPDLVKENLTLVRKSRHSRLR